MKNEVVVLEPSASATQRTHPSTPAMTDDHPSTTRKGWKFWITLFSICITFCVCSFELTVVAVGLPHILQATSTEFEFTWVVSTYLLSAAVAIPISHGLAHAIGRRPTFLISMALFLLGSGLAATWDVVGLAILIASKVPQGLGAGGLQTVGAIILSDHIAIEERARYSALINLYVRDSSKLR